MTEMTVDQRFGVATAVSVAGGITALCVMVSSRDFGSDFTFLRVALGGAFLAGLFCAGGFGRAGLAGVLWAALSFVAATFVGAVIAVWLMPYDALWMFKGGQYGSHLRETGGGLIGPLYVLMMVVEKQIALGGWALSGVVVHLLGLVVRTRG